MRTCTAYIHVSTLPASAGKFAWAREAGMRVDSLINTQPSGY
jgi:hypothetical protein